MNKIILTGCLVKNIDLKKSKNGKDYGLFTIAVNRKSDKEKTDFIDCICFDKQAETIDKYTEKGNRITIQGELNIDSYEDKDGIKQRQVKVIVNDFYFIDFKTNTQTEITD